MVEDKGRCWRGNGSEVEGHDKSIQLAPAVHNILGDGGIIQDIWALKTIKEKWQLCEIQKALKVQIQMVALMVVLVVETMMILQSTLWNHKDTALLDTGQTSGSLMWHKNVISLLDQIAAHYLT